MMNRRNFMQMLGAAIAGLCGAGNLARGKEVVHFSGLVLDGDRLTVKIVKGECVVTREQALRIARVDLDRMRSGTEPVSLKFKALSSGETRPIVDPEHAEVALAPRADGG